MNPRESILILLPLIPLFLFGTLSTRGRESDEKIQSTIVAMERAALDRSDKGDAEGFLEISAPDVVYIDPTLEQPIHGRDALAAYYRQFTGAGANRGTMKNVRVQVAGDVAVLTFNYFTARNWNTTEVYRRTKDGWRIIHTHWSYLKP